MKQSLVILNSIKAMTFIFSEKVQLGTGFQVQHTKFFKKMKKPKGLKSL
jgi:hypothetical protein